MVDLDLPEVPLVYACKHPVEEDPLSLGSFRFSRTGRILYATRICPDCLTKGYRFPEKGVLTDVQIGWEPKGSPEVIFLLKPEVPDGG